MSKTRALFLMLILVACDPLTPISTPTAQVIIVTPPPSATPLPSATPQATRTPLPTSTPDVTATPTVEPCQAEGGTMLAFEDFRSEIANETLPYRVYIPPCYLESQKRYPTIFLLHGQSFDEIQWDRLGIDEALDQGIRLNAIAPMIMVMPYTGSIANRDVFPPDPSYESVLLDELLPAIERDFCTWNDAAHRGIGGISRGGFWAFSIGMRHPDIFGRVGGHSAIFDDSNAPAAFNPLELALNASFLEDANMRIYMDNGANDTAAQQGQELLSSRLSERGIAHTYLIHPVGDHDEDYWQAHVSEYLEFYARDWPRDAAELSSCGEPSP